MDGFGSVRNEEVRITSLKKEVKELFNFFSPYEVQQAKRMLADMSYEGNWDKNNDSISLFGRRNTLKVYLSNHYRSGGYDDCPIYRSTDECTAWEFILPSANNN